jgi:hypothetical protein
MHHSEYSILPWHLGYELALSDLVRVSTILHRGSMPSRLSARYRVDLHCYIW